jgi:hypothetical protein
MKNPLYPSFIISRSSHVKEVSELPAATQISQHLGCKIDGNLGTGRIWDCVDRTQTGGKDLAAI